MTSPQVILCFVAKQKKNIKSTLLKYSHIHQTKTPHKRIKGDYARLQNNVTACRANIPSSK